MNEQPKKPVMEGRDISADGSLLKDETFHRKGMSTDGKGEKKDMEAIAESMDDFREAQAEMLAKIAPEIGRKSYEGLLKLHPNSPRFEKWKKRMEEL